MLGAIVVQQPRDAMSNNGNKIIYTLRWTDLNTAAKWLVGGRLIYEMYDEYQQRTNKIVEQPYIVPKDNTNVVQPQFIPYRLINK